MRSLERERDLLRCFRFREPERDLDLLLFGDLQRRQIRAIRSEHHKAVNSLIFQTKVTDLERDLECVLERVLMVFFSSVSKLSSSRPSGPSSRSMSYHSPAVTPHLHVFFLFLASEGANLLLVVDGVIQFGVALRKLRLAAVLRGCKRIVRAKDGVLPFDGNGLER